MAEQTEQTERRICALSAGLSSVHASTAACSLCSGKMAKREVGFVFTRAGVQGSN